MGDLFHLKIRIREYMEIDFHVDSTLHNNN
jgi:hypothetical protein